MAAGLLVRTVAGLADATFASIGCKATPTELVLAAAGHVITAVTLLHSMLAFGAALEYFSVFEKLQKSHLLGLLGILVVLLATSTAVPHTMVMEARFVVAGVATDNWSAVLSHV